MDLTEAMLHAKAGNAVVFLGAGFGVGAQSSSGPLLTGTQFNKELCDDLGLPPQTNLMEVTQIYQDEKGSQELKNFIETHFSAVSVESAHRTLASVPWRRIYTTNYDDVYEFAAKEMGQKTHSATLLERPDSLPRAVQAVIHFHGCVKVLRGQSPQSDFQLTLDSYLRSQFPTSDWVPVFRNDVTFASAVFFIGYSLNDLDITRIVYDETLAQKTFLIVHPSTTDVEQRRLRKFGHVILKEVSEFASDFQSLDTNETTKFDRPLICFEAQNFPAIKHPTQDSYIQLLTLGTFDDGSYAHQMTKPEPAYATPRSASRLAFETPSQRILVHSNIGNGKSIFLDELALLHTKSSFQVYKFKRRTDSFSSEVDYILSRGQERICLIFDGLKIAGEVIRYASSRLNPGDRLIISCRSITYEIDRDEVYGLIGRDFLELDLNKLTSEEMTHIESAFTQYGVWGKDSRLTTGHRVSLLREQCSSEMRSVVLRAFSEGTVADKLRSWSQNANSSHINAQKLVLAMVFAAIAHADVSLIDLCDIVRINYQSARKELVESGAIDIVSLTGVYAEIKSAVLAEHMARHTFPAELTIDTLTQLLYNIQNWLHAGDQYKEFMREIMRFAVIGRIFGGDRRDFIIQFYENVRNLEYCRSNPAFWLQYAMARMDREEFELAERMLDTAEGRAKAIRGYSLFQINNQKAKLLLTSRARMDKGDYDKIYIDCVRLVNAQFADGNGKRDPYPLRIIACHEEFITKRLNELSPGVRKLVPQLISRFEEGVNMYSHGGSQPGGWNDEIEWKASLLRTKAFVTSAGL